jgi:hypothetical protein
MSPREFPSPIDFQRNTTVLLPPMQLEHVNRIYSYSARFVLRIPGGETRQGQFKKQNTKSKIEEVTPASRDSTILILAL